MKTLILMFTLLLPGLLIAQSVERKVIASGGTVTVTTASVQVSQTIGETRVKGYAPGTLIVTEGFQQGSNTGVGIEPALETTTFTIFPNPVGDLLSLRIESTQPQELQLRFVDVLGRQVPIPARQIAVEGILTETFDFSAVASGTYLLIVQDAKTNAIRSLQVRKVD